MLKSPNELSQVENRFETTYKEGYMLKHRYLFWAAVIAVFVFAAGPAMAQTPDFMTTIEGGHWITEEDFVPADTAAPGETMSYVVGVNNIGDGDGNPRDEIVLSIYLPSGVPCDITAYLNEDPDAVAAYEALWDSLAFSENIFIEESEPDAHDGTAAFYGIDGYCEDFLLQPQNLNVPHGTEGAVFFDAVMPTPPLTEGFVHVTSTNIDKDLHYGRSGCADASENQNSLQVCQNHACMGPRINLMEPITETVELVNDGSDAPTEGCGPLVDFTAGNIALIRRGSCNFEEKVMNAMTAGASAVIIGDHDDFTDSTTDPDQVLGMACTDFCDESLITIPAIFISYNDMENILADLRLSFRIC